MNQHLLTFDTFMTYVSNIFLTCFFSQVNDFTFVVKKTRFSFFFIMGKIPLGPFFFFLISYSQRCHKSICFWQKSEFGFCINFYFCGNKKNIQTLNHISFYHRSSMFHFEIRNPIYKKYNSTKNQRTQHLYLESGK